MAIETLPGSRNLPYHEEDVGNIVLMEHVNVQQPDQQLSTLFFLVGLGFTRDPHMMVGLENMWVNLGEQQFHLPTGKPQVLRGHIGLVIPDYDSLPGRLESVAAKLEGTQFGWSQQDGYISVTGPFGNEFRCYPPSSELSISIGIPYVEFMVPAGTAEGIALFYERVFACPTLVESGVAKVGIGQYQKLIFRESEQVPEYDGHHIAVYVANFSAPYHYLAERGLVTEEPRNHQFRFVSIVHPDTGEKLFDIEHEVRGMHHPLFRRPLVNRTVGQFLEPRRVNGQTVLGSVM